MVFDSNLSTTSCVFAVPMTEKSAENVVQAYLPGILAPKAESVAILSDNGTEFKNKVFTEACDQLRIKRLFSNQFHPKVISRIENGHKFPK